MQEELNEFEKNEVWKLTLIPKIRSIVGTKWVEEPVPKIKRSKRQAKSQNQISGDKKNRIKEPIGQNTSISILNTQNY